MSEKYIDLGPRIFNTTGLDMPSKKRLASIHCVLRWLDEHPDQVPGRTITESKFKHAARKNQIGDSFGCYEGFLDDIGIKVIPDPEPTNAEPTNAEKLEVALTRLPWLGKDERRSIAEQLDCAGVKAKTNQEES